MAVLRHLCLQNACNFINVKLENILLDNIKSPKKDAIEVKVFGSLLFDIGR